MIWPLSGWKVDRSRGQVNGFYAPRGGGVRVYVDWKLAAAARHGHEISVIAPGTRNAVEQCERGAVYWVAAPPFPSTGGIGCWSMPRRCTAFSTN